MTYHQMGVVAQDQGNFETARKWCLKSLEIYQRLRNEYGVAKNYHELGELAYKQGDIKSAEDWYHRSLEITKRDGNEHEAASTFFELGEIALKRRQFEAARDLYLKSVELSEKYGNEHGAALAYGSLGVLEGMQKRYLESGKSLVRCISTFLKIKDQESADRNSKNFFISYSQASAADQEELESMWKEAGLGPFPEG